MHQVHAFIPTARGRVASLIWQTLVIGSLDWLSCSAYWASHGLSMWRVAQGPASWLLGERAFSLGPTGVALGATVMYALAAVAIVGYRQAGARFPVLLRHPLQWGALYGALLYALLFQVLLPMFAAATPHAVHGDWALVLLTIYMTLIGIPCAVFSQPRRAPQRVESTTRRVHSAHYSIPAH